MIIFTIIWNRSWWKCAKIRPLILLARNRRLPGRKNARKLSLKRLPNKIYINEEEILGSRLWQNKSLVRSLRLLHQRLVGCSKLRRKLISINWSWEMILCRKTSLAQKDLHQEVRQKKLKKGLSRGVDKFKQLVKVVNDLNHRLQDFLSFAPRIKLKSENL